MTTFGDYVLPSDEEDDEDDEEYVPGGEESSCEEVSSEDEVEESGNVSAPKTLKTSTKRKSAPSKVKKDEIAPRKKRRGCFTDPEECKPIEKEEEEKEEEEKEKEKTGNVEVEEADAGRSDSLWKDFLQRSKQPLKRETNTKTVERLYDFAGETVRVTETEEVPAAKKAAPKKLSTADLFPAKTAARSEQQSSSSPSSLRPTPSPSLPPSGPPRPNGKPSGGVSSLLDKLAAKKKISVLDKSRLDWNSFVSKEGIKEDLQIHNRGKEGYLEKVAFLERADYRQFEKERDLRLGVKRSNR